MGSGKRGRPRKTISIFKNGSSSTTRPRTQLAQEMMAGQTSLFRQLRRDYHAGLYTSNITISSLEKYSGSEDGATEELIEAQQAYAEAQKAYAEAQTKRKQDACRGGEARPTINLAAKIVREEADYIAAKRAQGWTRSRVINGIKARRTKKRSASRTEMYDQIRKSGLWD
jgi:hypothetical protein